MGGGLTMTEYHKWRTKTKELKRQVHKLEQSNIENAGDDGKALEFGYSQVVFEGDKKPLRLRKQNADRKRRDRQ